MRLATIGGVLIAGVVCAVAFCYFRPLDSYLLKSWESELSTLPDQDVEVRLEQIAALGETSLPTLAAALHSERRVVAVTAASLLRRTLAELELRSTDDSSRIVAGLAHELAALSNRPGPHSTPASTQLATRLLLWPINRKLIDGERLVADCEVIIRSAKRTTRGDVAAPTDLAAQTEFATSDNGVGTVELSTPLADGGLQIPLMPAPPLPPQDTGALPQGAGTPPEPPHFNPVHAPRALHARQGDAANEARERQTPQPLAVDPSNSRELPRDFASVPIGVKVRPDLRVMEDLDLMRQLAGDDESSARDAVDELYRRGFQTKHFRLAELLVDPDPNVRLALVRRLPQMPGIDSRPWLLWLSRDQEPVVRKAAVAVIATSSDSALQRRVRELEREETDEDVLRTVRQILNTQQSNTIR